MKRNIQIILAVAVIAVVAVFTLQNMEIVEVRFLWLELSMSRAILVIALLLTGFLIGRVTRWWPRKKK